MTNAVATKPKSTPVLEGLFKLLADITSLAIKTQNFHWNVTGPHFKEYHGLFEEEYNQLIPEQDSVAERIRALGAFVPASLETYKTATDIEPAKEGLSAHDMIEELAKGHEKLVAQSKKVLKEAESAGDPATADLVTEKIADHEKTAWMLRSHI